MIDRLTLFPFEALALDPGLTILSVQPPHTFFQLSQGLQSLNEDVVVSYDYKVLELSRSVFYVGDIAANTDLQAEYSKQAAQALSSLIDDSSLRILVELESKTKQVFESIIIDNSLPISIAHEFSLKTLVTAQKVTIDVTDTSSFYDKFQNILDVTSALNDQRLLVFTHMVEYLTQSELDYLARDIRRQERQVLFLEKHNNLVEITDGRSYYIDEHFVLFP